MGSPSTVSARTDRSRGAVAAATHTHDGAVRQRGAERVRDRLRRATRDLDALEPQQALDLPEIERPVESTQEGDHGQSKRMTTQRRIAVADPVRHRVFERPCSRAGQSLRPMRTRPTVEDAGAGDGQITRLDAGDERTTSFDEVGKPAIVFGQQPFGNAPATEQLEAGRTDHPERSGVADRSLGAVECERAVVPFPRPVELTAGEHIEPLLREPGDAIHRPSLVTGCDGPSRGWNYRATKYLALGWCRTIAEVVCSGWYW